MAVSKIKPITSTLKKAIDYIINPEKTEDGSLVSSVGCSVPAADIEMQMTGEKARNQSGRIAYHLIQSFSPDDEITPEKAHELGKEFADQMLGGKYEYVIATHVDKGHIHNHIIFNSTSFVDYKKYHMPAWHKYRMMNINDKICRENNLSVIEQKSGEKGKSWNRYNKQEGKTSWRNKIKDAIDQAVKEAADYEGFLHIMEMEGFEYKETDKLLEFKAAAEGQIKFTRTKTIGPSYTKEIIQKRIGDKSFVSEEGNEKKTSKRESEQDKKKLKIKNGMNLIVDISKNMKAQQSKGYEHALVMENINTMVKTMNYLQQNQIMTDAALLSRLEERYLMRDELTGRLNDLEKSRKALSEKIKYSQNYVKFKKTAAQAKREPVGSEFLTIHKDEILLFNVADLYMKKNGIDTTFLDIRQMIAQHKEYLEERKILNSEIKELNGKVKELETVRNNVEKILGERIGTEYERNRNTPFKKNEKSAELEI